MSWVTPMVPSPCILSNLGSGRPNGETISLRPGLLVIVPAVVHVVTAVAVASAIPTAVLISRPRLRYWLA